MSETITHSVINTPIGQLIISSSESHVHAIEWLKLPVDHSSQASKISPLAISQLTHYFLQTHNDWSLPLATKGTVFQRKVWQYLQTIPLGETRTYSEVAKVLNSSARAVGNACRVNPFVIVVPCHRVVSKTGLGGYSGKTDGNEVIIKQWLLDHEHG